jgi:hypothetical protein
MRAVTAPAILLVLSLSMNQPLWPCTIFKVTRQGRTLVGNNEDDNNPDTKVWFLVPEEGKYGRVFFGYNDAVPQGGMNDRGLFFDWVADNPSDDWIRDARKLNYGGSVSEKILEQAATVEEALRFYEIYNETAFSKSRTMLVDRDGATAIVSWRDGRLHIEKGKSDVIAMGYAGETARGKLNAIRVLSLDSVKCTLEACIQGGEYPTQYSNLYDLQRGDVYVYLFHRRQPFVKLNLKAELSRGNHYYNIPRIAAQLQQPPMTDHKTQPVAVVDPAIYAGYAGRYRIEPDDYVFTISAEGGKIYFEAQDVSRTEFYPASATRFFVRILEVYLTFKTGKDGRACKAVLHVRGKDKPALRIQ